MGGNPDANGDLEDWFLDSTWYGYQVGVVAVSHGGSELVDECRLDVEDSDDN